ncbi:MAG: multiheme c-type cytochrome, partial [Myxococcota bacterium]
TIHAACVDCHPEAASTWQGSLHHRSFSDSDFASAFAAEPRAVCRSCHAPEADPTLGVTAGALTDLGVACVTCHVARSPGGNGRRTARPTRGHPPLRSPELATASACASCHQFVFPDDPSRAMQATIDEHVQSPAADVPCIDCHMPRRPELAGARDHGFAASRDPAMLRSAVEVTAERVAAEGVTIELTPASIGHAFPTGDLYRRVVVTAEAFDGARQVAGDFAILGRQFDAGHRVEQDTRLGAGGDYAPRRIELGLPGAAGLSVRWSVSYERLDLPQHSDRAQEPFGSIELYRGWLPPHDAGGSTSVNPRGPAPR